MLLDFSTQHHRGSDIEEADEVAEEMTVHAATYDLRHTADRHTSTRSPGKKAVRALLSTVAATAMVLWACAAPTTQAEEPNSSGAGAPTIVLVHGAWADASSWTGEVAALQKQGYDARAIANPLENLATDAASVATFLRSLTGPIVLVGHSYGGSVITEAAADNPNVKALVYVDAAAPDVGETTGSLSGADSVLTVKPAAELYDTLPGPGGPTAASELYLKPDIFVQYFGNDLPADRATELWATQRAAATAAFDTPATQAAWKTVPSWYFISTGDQIITPAAEHAMAERAGSQVTTFDGGSHLSLISHPDAVTAVIMSAIASVGRS